MSIFFFAASQVYQLWWFTYAQVLQQICTYLVFSATCDTLAFSKHIFANRSRAGNAAGGAVAIWAAAAWHPPAAHNASCSAGVQHQTERIWTTQVLAVGVPSQAISVDNVFSLVFLGLTVCMYINVEWVKQLYHKVFLKVQSELKWLLLKTHSFLIQQELLLAITKLISFELYRKRTIIPKRDEQSSNIKISLTLIIFYSFALKFVLINIIRSQTSLLQL